MKRVNIISWDNGGGMTNTQKIIVQTLREAGFQITVHGIYPGGQGTYVERAKNLFLRQYFGFERAVERFFKQIFLPQPFYDINLFLEFVDPQWFPFARVNCLIPNQEWFHLKWLPYLKNFDYILCKTKHAQGIFKKLGCKTEFISFTSRDQLNKNQSKDYDSFFHLAGKSLQKGTQIERILKRDVNDILTQCQTVIVTQNSPSLLPVLQALKQLPIIDLVGLCKQPSADNFVLP